MYRYRPYLPPVIFFIALALVIYFVEPPTSVSQAKWWQLAAFFIPFFLLFLSALNLYFKFIWHSLLFAIALTILTVLHLLHSLTLVYAAVLIIATLLIYRSVNSRRRRYEVPVKIPKLSRLEKQH